MHGAQGACWQHTNCIVEYHDVSSCQQQLVMYTDVEHVGKGDQAEFVSVSIDARIRLCCCSCEFDVVFSMVYGAWDLIVFFQCYLQVEAQGK